MWWGTLKHDNAQIPVKLILVFRELCNASWGGEVQDFCTSYSHTEWKSKCGLLPILIVHVAAGPKTTSVSLFLYIIRTGIRSVPWLWNHTGGSSCWSELENYKCRQDTMHQKLMLANGTVGLNSLHSAHYSPVLQASRSASLQKPPSVCFGEKHILACILCRAQ